MSESSLEIEKYKLKEKDIIDIGHTSSITQISMFPSKNYVSVSYDKSIIIFDENSEVIHKIENAHEKEITYVCIKDDDNFATCGCDKNIKFWKKEDGEFKFNKKITNAHEKEVHKILFDSNGNLYSSSADYSIKIWKLTNDNNYTNVATLKNHEDEVYSFLIIEDKNLLISSGVGMDKTIFWDLNSYNKISEIENITCYTSNSMLRINDNIVVISEEDGQNLRFVDISQKKLIKEINNEFYVFGIYLMEEKGVFLVGGGSGIAVYRIDNFKKLQHVEYENDISGFFPMKDEVIATFGDNGKIQTWKFELRNENDDKEKSENSDNDDNDYDNDDNDDNSETN